MDNKFRFAVFTAVSSDPQAHEDKASLGAQVDTARSAGVSQGGTETAGPFILDGYSRTGYVNLSDALNEIPPLAQAVNDAAADKYDVLIMDNIERMGDLAPMLSTLFKKHRKQIHSARQSGRIHDPSSYDPSADDASDIMIHVEGIIQQYRLNKLRRGYNIGIPNRIKRGLVPFRVGFGYTRVDSKTPPVQNEYARHVIQMKDWLLEGRAQSWIAEQLTARGVPSPNQSGKGWHVESIRHILLNPFYCGVVAIGQKRREQGKKGRLYRQRTPQSEWTAGRGGHVPLWDEGIYLAIQNEYARRAGLKNYAKTMYPLAGLLRCTECQQKLIRRHISRGGQLLPGLGCKRGNSHARIEYQLAIDLLADALKKEIQKHKHSPSTQQEEEDRLNARLVDLAEQRTLIQEGFQAKIYKASEASAHVQEIERQEQTIQKELADLRRLQQTRAEMQLIAGGLLDIDDLAGWIRSDDPAIVNRLLSALCEVVWVTPEFQFTIQWRE